MFVDTVKTVSDISEKRFNFFKTHPGGFWVSSMWAGAAVGLGMILLCIIGAIGTKNNTPFSNLIMAFAFSVALSLVVTFGVELFTGNMFVMTVGTLDRKGSWLQVSKMLTANYLGNFLGSILLAVLYYYSGLAGTITSEFILQVAMAKTSHSFMVLLIKGIMCNVMVCLAVVICTKLKSETAKLIMIFWCIFTFVLCGFEHSIANMTLFSLSTLLGQTSEVSITAMASNLIPVTIGNIIGGGLVVGGSVYYMGK